MAKKSKKSNITVEMDPKKMMMKGKEMMSKGKMMMKKAEMMMKGK